MGEWASVGKGGVLRGDAVRPGQLDEGALIAQQAQQRLEAGHRRALFGRDVAEMTEHDIDRQPLSIRSSSGNSSTCIRNSMCHPNGLMRSASLSMRSIG